MRCALRSAALNAGVKDRVRSESLLLVSCSNAFPPADTRFRWEYRVFVVAGAGGAGFGDLGISGGGNGGRGGLFGTGGTGEAGGIPDGVNGTNGTNGL
jgi:hypothetical protein